MSTPCRFESWVKMARILAQGTMVLCAFIYVNPPPNLLNFGHQPSSGGLTLDTVDTVDYFNGTIKRSSVNVSVSRVSVTVSKSFEIQNTVSSSVTSFEENAVSSR